MYIAKNVEQMQVEDDGRESYKRQKPYNYTLLAVKCMLWFLAIAAMIGLSFFAHAHPRPLPFELTVTRDLQGMSFPPAVQAIMRWFTAIDDPLPDIIIVPVCVLILALFRKFMAAIFLALSTGIGNGIDALIGDYVGRPRPSVHLVHVDSVLIFNSFPSGHCCHMMVFYGFLLYLSLTKPVRQWRYRWALVPLQIFAVINILIMGFARLWEGEHWLIDILGGYLDGAIWMVLFIFLYNWTIDRMRERRFRKAVPA